MSRKADDHKRREEAVRQAHFDRQRKRDIITGKTPEPMPSHKPNRKKVETPVFSECVIGFRWWTIDAFGRLRPQSVDQRPWVPGVNVAKCDVANLWMVSGYPPKKHKAPHKDCECGLYARFSLDETPSLNAYTDADTHALDRLVQPPVVGAVASWGNMQVHRDGMRAEKSCVTALALMPGMPAEVVELVQRVAATYRVPAVPLDMLAMEAGQHGAPLPDSVKPKKQPDPYRELYYNASQFWVQPPPMPSASAQYIWTTSSAHTGP